MIDSNIADALTLLTVLNPVAIVPLFLSATGLESPASRRRIAGRGILFATVILVGFVVLGQLMLKSLGISMPSFKIAGGLVLLTISMKMIFADESARRPPRADGDGKEPESRGDLAIFPVAMPFIAGPGAIMAIVMLTDNERFSVREQAETTAVMLGVLGVVYLTLLAAGWVQRTLGSTGINVLTRVMGLILSALSVEAILAGIRQSFSLG